LKNKFLINQIVRLSFYFCNR